MLKIGDLVRVDASLRPRYHGKIPVNFAGEVGWITGTTSPNGGALIYYVVCSDRDEPRHPWKDHMWHEQFSEQELSLVNEEQDAMEVLGEDYFA